jgi:hypothetical protein
MWFSRFQSARSVNGIPTKQEIWPAEFKPEIFRKRYPELSHHDDETLHFHYQSAGIAAGQIGNELTTRQDLLACIPVTKRILEIGPFANPVLRQPNVEYADALNQEQLQSRAVELDMDPKAVPTIHHVLVDGVLPADAGPYDLALSCHCIEHQPDLVAHLLQVQACLTPLEGEYLLLVPDHRYCFDHHLAPSSIAQVLMAHEEKRKRHTLCSVIEHRALTTHSDAARHWDEVPHAVPTISAAQIQSAIDEWRDSNGAYVDVHAWYFTPQSFAGIIDLLHQLGLINLCVKHLYPTRRYAHEFWVVLGFNDAPTA